MKQIFFATIAALPCVGFAACGNTQSQSPGVNAAESAVEVPTQQMSVAKPASKTSVPVEVRYQLASKAVAEQPATLQLAFTPRVAGQNLRVEFLPSDSVSIDSDHTPFAQQKTDAAGVYRRNLIVTPRKSGMSEMRVLVSMDVEGGRYFGVFTVPVGNGTTDR